MPGATRRAVRRGVFGPQSHTVERIPALRLAALALLAGIAPALACPPEQRASLPLRVQEGFPLVPASIDGTAVTLLLDTGAQGNLLTPEAVRRLGLPRDPGVSTRMYGTGGAQDVPNVLLRGLRLGGLAIPSQSTPMAAFPGAVPATDPPLAGLLGAGVLAAYDLDLDVPGGRLSLYAPRPCNAPPLPGRTTAVPLELTAEGEAFLPVVVNGQTLLALLDTGSRATLLTEGAARRLGLSGPPSANTARGLDGAPLPVRHHRVREMRVGEDVRADVPVSVAPLQLSRGEMLLGLDYLGTRRVWVSYAGRRVVIGLGGAASPPASPR